MVITILPVGSVEDPVDGWRAQSGVQKAGSGEARGLVRVAGMGGAGGGKVRLVGRYGWWGGVGVGHVMLGKVKGRITVSGSSPSASSRSGRSAYARQWEQGPSHDSRACPRLPLGRFVHV